MTDAYPAIRDALTDCLVQTTRLEDDGTLGIPVDIYTYTRTDAGIRTPVMEYVINTNTKRTGTESDVSILSEYVNEYIVLILDYRNHPATTAIPVANSAHFLQYKIGSGFCIGERKYLRNGDNWLLPAGCRVLRRFPYYNFEKNGANGTTDWIVHIWNTVFREQKGGREIVFPDGRTVLPRDIDAKCVSDCLNRDGTPIDLNLYLDIIYPTEPEGDDALPVLAMAVSRQSTTGNFFHVAGNPEYIATLLFEGYGALLYEYPYIPMARADHYGYFDENGGTGGQLYGLRQWVGIRSSCAAVRCFRYLVGSRPELSRLSGKLGVICISKTGYNLFLGTENPEKAPEGEFFKGHHGECDAPQPWLYYEGHEGDEAFRISPRIDAVYSVSGSQQYNMRPGMCPVAVTAGLLDSVCYHGHYKTVRNTAKQYNIPCVYYSRSDLGHAYIDGKHEKYGFDMYAMMTEFFHTHLRGDGVTCEYIDPPSGSSELSVDRDIVLKFTGPVPRAEILGKVKIRNLTDGISPAGNWHSLYGDCEWHFSPDALGAGASYEVLVPATLSGRNGKPVKAAKRAVLAVAPGAKTVRDPVRQEQEKTVCDLVFDGSSDGWRSYLDGAGTLSVEEGVPCLRLDRADGAYSFHDLLGLPDPITEADLGRHFRVSLSYMTRDPMLPRFLRVSVDYLPREERGVNQYVDWNDTTWHMLHPEDTPGVWQSLTFDYRIDDPDYIDPRIQKRKLTITHDAGVLYLGHLRVTELI